MNGLIQPLFRIGDKVTVHRCRLDDEPERKAVRINTIITSETTSLVQTQLGGVYDKWTGSGAGACVRPFYDAIHHTDYPTSGRTQQ